MLKRSFDVIVSGLGLIVTSPVLLAAMAAIFLQDYRSPFYIASRVGKDGRAFDMVKLRSMVVAAEREIPRGVTIRQSELVLKRAGRLVTRSTQFHSIDDLIGMQVTLSIAEGQLLDTSYVRKPILVRQGDIVTVYALGA